MGARIIGILVILGAIAALLSAYTVHETERGILFKFGRIVESDIRPGLHFKIPIINNVRTFDIRVLNLDAQPERFLTIEKKNVSVDYFVKWQIKDVRQYYVALRGDEDNARNRLSQIVKDDLRNEFGNRTIQEAVSGERKQIMDSLRIKTNLVAERLGINVVDVRISRIDLPDEVSGSVYDRMRAERERAAKEFRARGKEEAEKIRAEADRERTVILANAYKDSEQIRGEGDAIAAETYAKAYGADPEF